MRVREQRLRDSLDALVRDANRKSKKASPREGLSSARARPRPADGPRSTTREAASAPADTQIVHPAPALRAGRARARPLVVRAPGPGGPSADGSCLCHVEGTVEVRSGAPLKRPERVEVSLQGYPRVKDTVELFMGSPRFFMLPAVPCGMHRLQLRVVSGRRYEVLSRDALGYFRCSRDRHIQRKVVLAPF